MSGSRSMPTCRTAPDLFRPSLWFTAVVSFYGPQDLESRARSQGTLSDSVKAFLGVSELSNKTWETLRSASPITHVSKDMPPYLLIHGTKDDLVPYDQSVRMCEKMK